MESVWDYPRPPALEAEARPIRVQWQDQVVASTTAALRVLETSHPPTYYLPLSSVAPGYLEPSDRRSYCEFKGQAHYFNLRIGDQVWPNVAWTYPQPTPAYAALAGCVAFYLNPLRAWVGKEEARPQPGRFYGGWITSWVRGPFKGGPGTQGW